MALFETSDTPMGCGRFLGICWGTFRANRATGKQTRDRSGWPR
jgi:hypothetical protein